MGSFPVTFVNARTHLGKTYTDSGNQRPPHAKNLTSMEYPLTADQSGLDVLTALVRKHTGAGDAFFTGAFTKPLMDESRAGRSNARFKPQVLVVDLDDVPLDTPLSPPISPEKLVQVSTELRKLLPVELADTGCVAHASSSFGLKPGRVSLHLMFILDKPIASQRLKSWLTWANFQNPDVEAAIELSPSGQSLKFPIDRCTADNSRLIYIAAPQFMGKLTSDPFTQPVDRVVQVPGSRSVASLADSVDAINPQTADSLVREKIKELRKEQGLPNRQAKLAIVETRKGNFHEILNNPDQVVIEIAYEREPFVYGNLNGGDSNAYYWPKDNPKYIYNFKDEPVVEMAKVAPDFYREYLASMKQDEAVDEAYRPLVFRDFHADHYYTVLHDKTDVVEVAKASRTALEDFMVQYGGELPPIIESWQVGFNPSSPVQLDFDKKFYNLFKPTRYLAMQASEESSADYGNALDAVEKLTPNIASLLLHVMGNSRQEFEHFINWLSYIINNRRKTSIAWVFHGCEGTGKGIMFKEILKPLFGQYASIKGINDLEDGFNGWREQCLLVAFDEFRMADAKEGSRLYDRLKNMISEEVGTVRAMYSNQKDIQLYENLIFFSNSHDAMRISATDRRFCVAAPQNTPLKEKMDTIKLIESIRMELDFFAQFLVDFDYSETHARLALETEAKTQMRQAAATWVEDFCMALKNGQLEWFVDNILYIRATSPEATIRQAQASEVIARFILDVMNQGILRDHVSLDEACILFAAVSNGGDNRKVAIAKLMARYGLIFERRRIGGDRNRFFAVNWDTGELDLSALMKQCGNPVQQSEAVTH